MMANVIATKTTEASMTSYFSTPIPRKAFAKINTKKFYINYTGY